MFLQGILKEIPLLKEVASILIFNQATYGIFKANL